MVVEQIIEVGEKVLTDDSRDAAVDAVQDGEVRFEDRQLVYLRTAYGQRCQPAYRRGLAAGHRVRFPECSVGRANLWASAVSTMVFSAPVSSTK